MMRTYTAGAVAGVVLLGLVAARPAEARAPIVPAGTRLRVALDTSVSSASSQRGDKVLATLASDVLVSGQVAIPAGSELRGRVVSVRKPGRTKGRGSIGINFSELVVKGQSHAISTYSVYHLAKSSKGKEARMVAGAAGAGAVIGAIKNGAEGAAVGAAVGAGAGTGVAITTRGPQATMPAGSHWRVRLRRSVQID